MRLSSPPAWLTELTDRAALRAKDLGLPLKTDETWRYSNINKLSMNDWSAVLSGQQDFQLPQDVQDLAKDYDHVLFFYNGDYLDVASRPSLEENLLVCNYSRALRSAGRVHDIARQRFDRLPSPNLRGIGFQQLSQFRDGALLHLRDESRRPKILVANIFGNMLGAKEQRPFAVSPRTTVVLGDRVAADVVVLNLSTNDVAFLNNSAIDLHVGEGASVTLGLATWLGDEPLAITDLTVSAGRNSSVKIADMSVSGRLNRNEFRFDLLGEGADLDLETLSIGRGSGYIDLSSSIQHVVGQTTSRQIARGIFLDTSRGVFSGHLKIAEDAQKSNARQLTQNVLLSSSAEVDAKPQLEVLADDVKAAHGATVGQIRDEEVFYLMSRGVSKDAAHRLIVEGFGKATFGNISAIGRETLGNLFSAVSQGLTWETKQ